MTREDLQRDLPERFKRLGIPPDVARVLSEPLLDTPAVRAISKPWANAAAIVLAGGNGCGKTVAACSTLLTHCLDNATRAFYRTPGDMPPSWIWRGAMYARADTVAILSAFDDEDQAKHGSLLATPLLILDELGNEDGDGERGLGRLLCDRVSDDGRRTIVTTNLSRDNFAARYGKRLMSRLGPDAIVTVHAKDLRQS